MDGSIPAAINSGEAEVASRFAPVDSWSSFQFTDAGIASTEKNERWWGRGGDAENPAAAGVAAMVVATIFAITDQSANADNEYCRYDMLRK
jgi:hypothetical protein